MATFLIQCEKINNNLIPLHDFGFELIQAIKFDEWFRREKRHNLILVDDDAIQYKNCIPVGSIEFVSNYIHSINPNIKVKPLNIPESLIPYANRFVKRVNNVEIREFLKNKEMFVKSDDQIKGFCEFCDNNTNFPEGTYIISDLDEFKSEWRCFIRNNTMLDLKCYSGDLVVPDIERIYEMIKSFKNSPPAYTLDVGINNNNETVIIECHNFFSCGLYGFSDSKYYIDMLIKSFNWQIKQ